MNASIQGDGRGMQAMSIAAARKGLHNLPDRVKDEPVFVTKDGRPVLVILSFDQYEGLWETIEYLDDQAFGNRSRGSLVRANSGGQVSKEDVSEPIGS